MVKWINWLLTAGLVTVCAQAPAQKKPAPPLKSVSVKALHPANSAGAVVTWGYLRTHHPEVLPKALASANPKLLAGFGSPALLDAMRRAATLNPDLFKRKLNVGGSSGFEERTLLNYGAIMKSAAVGPDVSPAKAVFPDAWDKQVTNVKIQVVPSADGTLTASLADPNQPFKITRLVVYTGQCQAPGGNTSYQVHVPKGASSLPPNVPVVQPLMPIIAASVTHAPFTATVQAGADVEVDLAFDPVFNLVTQSAGFYNDTLSLTQGSSRTNVPMSGKFDGRPIGVMTVLDDYQPQVIVGGYNWTRTTNASNTTELSSVALPETLHITNLGNKPAQLVLSTSWGNGVYPSFQSGYETGIPCTVGVGQTLDVVLNINISVGPPGTPGAIAPGTPEVEVAFQETDSLGGNKSVTIPVTLVWPATTWTTKSPVGLPSYYGEFVLWPTGDYELLGVTQAAAPGTTIFVFQSTIGQLVALSVGFDPTTSNAFGSTASSYGSRPDYGANLEAVMKSGSLQAETNFPP